MVIQDRLIAYIVGADVSVEDETATLRASMPAYMIPLMMLIDAFPLMANGKIDRRALPIPTTDTEYVEPTTDDEIKIAEHWRQTLGIKKIGIYDDF